MRSATVVFDPVPFTPRHRKPAMPSTSRRTAVTPLTDPEEWRRIHRSIGDFDSYHTPEYQKPVAGAGNHTVLLSYRDSGIEAAVPLTLRPLPEPVRAATGYDVDATSVYGYPGPLRTSRRDDPNAGPLEIDDAWAARFVAWFTEVMADMRVLTAFIRCHPLLDAADMFDRDPFVLSAPTPTVAVDLTAPREERLRRASAHHRRALRRSLAHGLTFEHDQGPEAVAAFTACYQETMARHRSGASYWLDEERVSALLDAFGDMAELWIARKPDGEAASAALFLRTNGILQYHLGGTRTADYALGAARPLFEAVAESGHVRGDRWLHLGGGVGGGDDSLLRYKAGFGPDRFAFRTIRAVFDPEAYDAAIRAAGSGEAGPTPVNGFFPAYRTGGLGVAGDLVQNRSAQHPS